MFRTSALERLAAWRRRVRCPVWLGVRAGEHLPDPVECRLLPQGRAEAAAMAARPVCLAEPLEPLLARQQVEQSAALRGEVALDRKSTRLNSSHANISYAVF